jgi:hypothetical protein
VRGSRFALALVAACGGRSDDPHAAPPAPRPVPAATAMADAGVIDAGAAVTIAQPGPAYLIADGAFRLDGAGPATTLERRDELFSRSTLDEAGRLWVAAKGPSVTVYDATPRHVRLPGDIVALARAAGGGVWAIAKVGDRGQLIRVGADLSVHAIAPPTADTGDLVDLDGGAIADTADTVWLAGPFGLLQYTPATHAWSPLRDDMLRALVRGSDGVLWMLDDAGQRVLGLDGSTWIELAYPPNIRSVQNLAPAPDGSIIALFKKSVSDGWLAGFRRRGATAAWDRPAIGFPHAVEDLLAIDGAGRIWVDERGGLSVLAPDGQPIAVYPNAMLPGVVGSELYAAYVVGDGPASFPPPAPTASGTIRGRLINDRGAPAAGTALELCVGECDDGAPKLTIRADDDGRCEVDHVVFTSYPTARPVGAAFTMGTEFALVPRGAKRGIDCCLQLTPGGSVDLGTLVDDLDEGVP